MDEAAVKAEWRLYAVEWAVSQLWATFLRLHGVGPELLDQIRQQAIASARAKTFQNLDPAMSDLMSAELEAAIDRILQMISAQSGPSSPPKSRP